MGLSLLRNPTLKQKFRGIQGFSLIELLVVISISSVLFGFAVPSYRSFQANQNITQVVKTLDTNIRFAQSQARAGVKGPLCAATTPASPPLIGWFIHSTEAYSYNIYVRCQDQNPELIKTIRLPSSVFIRIADELTSGIDIIFQPNNMDVLFGSAGSGTALASSDGSTEGVITIQSTQLGIAYAIHIRATGDIYQANASPLPTPTAGPPTATPTLLPSPSLTPTPTPVPPTSIPTNTLGYTGIAPFSEVFMSNRLNATRHVMGAFGGTVSSMSVYVDAPVNAAPNNLFQVAIYIDNGGIPGTLLAQSSSRTLTANSWNTAPISANLSANTPYWLAYNSNGTTGSYNNLRIDNGAVGQTCISWPVSFGSWPPFPLRSCGDAQYTIYATYTPSGAGPTLTPTPTVVPTATPIPTSTPTTAPPTPTPTPSSFTCPCSIWSSSATPAQIASDGNSVELGVKFRSEVSGTITGIRYYKDFNNVGTHVGSLWTNSGTLLAQATFTNEGPNGWQQVNFASPVAIAANTNYVASYHASFGRYARDSGYFSGSGFDNPPLHALQYGVDGGNGLYLYGAGGFPINSAASNYWVDVVFSP